MKDYTITWKRTIFAESTVRARNKSEARRLALEGQDMNWDTLDGSEKDQITGISVNRYQRG